MVEDKRKLPVGWVETKLSEVASLRNEKVNPLVVGTKKYISLEHIESGTTRIIDYGSSKDVKSLKAVFSSGNVLYGKLRPYLNKVCQPEFDGICSTDILVFGPSLALENSFLMRLLSKKETVEYANRHSKGINLPRISPKQLGELVVDLPPLNEQKRIIAKIEEFQARSRRARESLETIPDLLEQLRQSILAEAFRGDLTKNWREKHKGKIEPATELLKRIRTERRKRWEESELEKLKTKGLTDKKLDEAFNKRRKQYKEPVPADTTDLPELPEGWCWTNLNELKEYSIYGPRFSNDQYAKSGTFVLRTTDIDDSGRVNTQTAPQIKLSKKEVEKYMVHIGDLLITRTGSIGTLAVYNDEVEAIPGAYLLHYRLAWDNELSWIIFHQLKSPRCQDKMAGGSAGTGRPNLNAPTLESIPLTLPPVEEQTAIIEKLNSVLELIESIKLKYESSVDQIEFFDQSILSKAFCGELVPQDPNDEPASVLLERIQQEKVRLTAEQKTKSKRRGKKMKRRESKRQDILTILKEATHAMTPEEVFTAGGFAEDSVDTFYEQLRDAVAKKQAREIRKGDAVQLEAI